MQRLAVSRLSPKPHGAFSDELKARHPQIGWKQMAGAGNVYRHDYEDVSAHFVWNTVHDALPPLRSVVEEELSGDGS